VTLLCMTPVELEAWEGTNVRIQNPRERALGPCADCLLAYALEMRAAGRCDGTPGGVEEDDDVTMDPRSRPGLRPGPDVLPAPAELQPGRWSDLDVLFPPCGSCSHEQVCHLRIALEGVARVEIIAPDLPAGLKLRIGATVECSAYSRGRSRPAAVRALSHEERGGAITGAKRAISAETREKMRQSALAAIARKRGGA